jgi:hypothetical protein
MIERGTALDRISFLRFLRAVRSFRPDPVPDEVVNDVLEVAGWSGSASDRRRRSSSRSTAARRCALADVEGCAGHLARASLETMPLMAGERPAQETYDEGCLSERIMLAAHEPGVGSSIG